VRQCVVQAILRDRLPAEIRQQWMQRVVHAVEAAYSGSDFANWSVFEHWLPHALTCAAWIMQVSLTTFPAARLLNQAGYYLYERGRYGEAEPLLAHALVLREQQLGERHPDVALRHGKSYPLVHKDSNPSVVKMGLAWLCWPILIMFLFESLCTRYFVSSHSRPEKVPLPYSCYASLPQ
jgi:Tetratricopeptide repeat